MGAVVMPWISEFVPVDGEKMNLYDVIIYEMKFGWNKE